MKRALRFWFLWLPLGFLTILVLAWYAWYGLARWELNRLKAKLVQEGFPSTVAEVSPTKIPESENAAPFLLNAEETWNRLKESEGFIVPILGSNSENHNPQIFDDEKLEKLREQMQSPEVESLFQMLHEAAIKPAARFDRDYSKGPALELGPIGFSLPAVRLLGAQAWLAAGNGNQQEAAKALWTASRLATLWLQDISIVGWLVGASMDQLSISFTQNVLSVLPPHSFRMEDWKKLDELWSDHAEEVRQNLARTLKAERLFVGTWFYEGILAGNMSAIDSITETFPPRSPTQMMTLRRSTSMYSTILAPWFFSDYAAYLRQMLLLHNIIKNGESSDKIKEQLSADVPKFAILAHLMIQGLDGLPKHLAIYETNLQLARLGLRLEDFREQHGKYPATLQELGLPTAMITDPFTGKPFIYQAEGNNVLVYSVGSNRSDDSTTSKKSRNIVWRVERRPASEK